MEPHSAHASSGQAPAPALILLDTNAVLFLTSRHRRARPLEEHAGRLYFTPFALLEMRFLEEVGRGSFVATSPHEAAEKDPRWTVDNPPLDAVIARAMDLSWTRDPFDRLISAHALHRGWRLATSDALIIRSLPPGSTFPL